MIRFFVTSGIVAILLAACAATDPIEPNSKIDDQAANSSQNKDEIACMSSSLAKRIEAYGQTVNEDVFPAFRSQVTLANIRCKDDPESPVCSDFGTVHEALVPLTQAIETLREKFVSMDDQGQLQSLCESELYWNNIAYGNLNAAVNGFEKCVQTEVCISTGQTVKMGFTLDTETEELVVIAEQSIKALETALASRRDSMRQ